MPRRRRPPRRGGRRWGPPPGPPPGRPGRPGPRREAWESITTRRTPPAAPGARSPCSEERVGRWRRCAAVAALAARRRCRRLRLGGLAARLLRLRASWALALLRALAGGLDAGRSKPACRSAAGAGAAGAAAAVGRLRRRLAGQRAVGLVLVDGRRGRLDLDAVAFSRFRTSAEGMSYCLASSWTRFLAMW